MAKRKTVADAKREAAEAGAAPAVFLPAPGADPALDAEAEAAMKAKPIALAWDDPQHPLGVEYHATSGRPIVRYGPAPSCPEGEQLDWLCARVIEFGAQGYSQNAIAFKLGIPTSTLHSWAKQPYGEKLRLSLVAAAQLSLGAVEAEARDNFDNKSYNAALFGKVVGAEHAAYRAAGLAPPADPAGDGLPALPGTATETELLRRVFSIIDRIVHAREAPAPALELKAEKVEQ